MCGFSFQVASHSTHVACAGPQAASEQPDQVDQALRRIAATIGKPSKFVKAAGLVRQLLASGQVTREQHRQSLFKVSSTQCCQLPERPRSRSNLSVAGACGVHGRPRQLSLA